MRGLLWRFTSRGAEPPAKIPMPPLPSGRRLTSVDELVRGAERIPSMLSAEAGKFLYALCYLQTLPGDVVEVGSWQGYSTSFLARATRDSANGALFAIDHFRGNAGTEDRYVVGRPDLSDLRDNFERNMRSLGLWESVHLLDMPDEEAASRLAGHRLRFLFVDGDHTRAGVERDIRLFFPMLQPSALVVFDDFSARFPGLVAAVDHLLETTPVQRAFSFRNTLVVMVAGA